MSKREYIIANRKWLEDKAKEEGVEALPKGIYYKVLKSGDPNGTQPQKRSIVTVHYTGWTIDGKKFDTSIGGTPIAMRLSDLIDGWIIALNRCTLETSGSFTSLPRWATANTPSLAFPVAPHSSLTLS